MPNKARHCDTLEKVSESFRPFMREILRDLNFGLCRSKVDFEKVRSSTNSKNNLADQFTLVLPYAGHTLKWEVLFDSFSPWFAPDFRFDDETFLANVDADFLDKHVPSLANWNDDDPKSLSNVISELIVLYREHQKTLLSEDENSRAYFEYSTLLGGSNIQESDVELFVGRGESVNFMIKLNIDYSQLPALFNDDIYENPGGECAVLLIKYPNPSTADLIMSPLVTRAVGDITLPQIHQNAVLIDYVPNVTNLINKKISMVFENEKHRQEMLSRFIVKYEEGILEHDSNTASFLLEVKNFYCILHIEIGVSFPEKPPKLTLRSVYHSHKRRPKVKELPLCPYERIQEYITQQIEIFQLECSDAIVNVEEK